ncbi:MAG: hypothetical protein WC875_02910 [Candidatus Absconditabacterales bacterium]|jgi:hypothetical protein
MKKTKQELFDQFQKEFDRKRKQEIWVLLITAHIAGFGMFGYPLLVILSSPLLIKAGVVVLIETFVLIASFLVTVGENRRDFNLKFLSKDVTEKIKEMKTKKSELVKKRDCFVPKGFYEKILPTFQGEFREHFLTHMTVDGLSLKEIDEKLTEFDEQINELKIKLEFYDQVPERNFWQYAKSMKWIKKIKKCTT